MPLKSLGDSADHIQTGPENERPKSPDQGEVRFNTTSEDFEIWEGTRWVSMRPPVGAPITDHDRTLGLALGRGVQAPEGLLEAYLGDGLGFDDKGRIEAQGNGDVIIVHQPIIKSVTPSFANEQLTIGDQGAMVFPETKTLDFEIPKSCNAALVWCAYRVSVRPHPEAVYPGGEGYFAQTIVCNANWKGDVFGRNAYFPSAEAEERIGAECSTTVAHVPLVDGRGNQEHAFTWWSVKIEEMRFDHSNSNISFTFSFECSRNTSLIIYNVIRCAILPYERTH